MGSDKGGERTAVLEELRARGLLPPSDAPIDSLVGPDGVPESKVRGALVGTAIGDALGRPAEGHTRETVQEFYGELRDFVPHPGWTDGPIGTWSDDTQMTVCVAESLIAGGGRLDPDDLAQRFVEWLPIGRGMGATCVEAVERFIAGRPWWQAGVASAGNGAAMRAAPVGVVHAGDVSALRHDAALSAVITHADPMAVSSAIAQAFVVAWCATCRPSYLDAGELLDALREVLSDVHDPGHVERRPDAGSVPVRLVDRLCEVGDMLAWRPEAAFDLLQSGAFVLESLPAALWCFLRSPDDPEDVVVTAVQGGYDADTIAAMAGAMVGAYLGDEAFPERWRGEALEDEDRLFELAAHLDRPSASSG